MPARPAPTRAHHRAFVEAEGWDALGRVSGGVGDHYKYQLRLPDGRLLQTRISHPPGKETYGASLWSHVLRDQLAVSAEEFWACVHDGVLPERSRSPDEQQAIPADLAWQLIHRVGLAEQAVRAMTRDEAIARMNEFWTSGQ